MAVCTLGARAVLGLDRKQDMRQLGFLVALTCRQPACPLHMRTNVPLECPSGAPTSELGSSWKNWPHQVFHRWGLNRG